MSARLLFVEISVSRSGCAQKVILHRVEDTQFAQAAAYTKLAGRFWHEGGLRSGCAGLKHCDSGLI